MSRSVRCSRGPYCGVPGGGAGARAAVEGLLGAAPR